MVCVCVKDVVSKMVCVTKVCVCVTKRCVCVCDKGVCVCVTKEGVCVCVFSNTPFCVCKRFVPASIAQWLWFLFGILWLQLPRHFLEKGWYV